MKRFILFALGALAVGDAYAQTGVASGTRYGIGQDSIDCITNTSLYTPYAKSKNYKDAYPFWKKVYDACPGSNKNIYVYGVDIIEWQISQETDAAKKEELINEMMTLYDNRIKYFGNDKKYGKDWIIAQKAKDYNRLKGDATDYSLMYKWTGEVVNEYKEKADPLAISMYMFASYKLMQNDDSKKDQYIQDYFATNEYLETALANAKAANDTKEVNSIESHKSNIEANFATSGVADCETLQKLYGPKIEENKDNLDFLKKAMAIMSIGRSTDGKCTESDTYITAAEYAYRLEPSADAAVGLGSKAFKSGDLAAAEKYYTEAVNLTDDASKKADLYNGIASMAYKQHNYGKVKQYALKSIAEKENGLAYLLIAQAYAGCAKSTSDDPVLMKCAYYAVVDKAQKAKSLDPSLANEANSLIGYSRYFPTKEEIFMHPSINAGGTYTVGGCIGETVRIR